MKDKLGLKKLHDVYESVVRNRIVVAVVALVMLGAAISYLVLAPRQYLAGANVLVVNGNTRDDPTLSSPDLPSIATSTVVLERVRKDLGLDISLKEMKKGLSAKPPPFKSSILRIQYTDSDGARAAQIANGVADELALYYRDISTKRYDADLTALNAELAKQSDIIRKIDREVTARGGAIGDTSATPGASADSSVDPAQLSTLERDRALANATLQGDLAHLDSVRLSTGARQQLSQRDVLQNDPLYQNLRTEASADAAALAKMRAVFRPSYPELPALENKVNSLNAAAAAEERRALSAPHAFSPSLSAADADERKAEAVVAGDRAQVAAFDDLIAEQHDRTNSLAPLAQLRLERNAAKENYLAISSRLAAALANRADALSLGSVVVVDRAIASETQIVGLGRGSLSIILAFLIVAVSIGSALLADSLNPRLRRISQVEMLYGHPVIATFGTPK